MSDTAKSAMNTIILLDGEDFQQLLTTARLPLSKLDIETPIFGRRDMESISGMRNGALNVEGFRMGDKTQYQNLVKGAIGTETNRHALLYAQEGDLVGQNCWIIDSNNNSSEVGGPHTGAIMVTAVFQATGGPRFGDVLHGCHQELLYYEPGSYDLVFSNIPTADVFYVRSKGSNRRSNAALNFGAGFDNAQIEAALKAAFESLATYNGRIFTVVSNMVLAAGNWNGTVNVSISGGETLPPEVLHNRVNTVSVEVGMTNLTYEAASGVSAVVDGGYATIGGYTSHIHVVGYKGDGTQTLNSKVEHSDDGVTWNDLFVFTAKISKGYQRVVSPNKWDEVKRYTRESRTITGVGGQFAYAVGLSRFGKAD